MAIGYVSETSVAWAAGFFDGEGTVITRLFLRNGRQHRNIECGIGQVDREVLDRFREIVGVGAVNGPYDRSARRSPMYFYDARKIKDVRHIHHLLSPYLGTVKLAQFKKAIETYEQLELIRRPTLTREREIRRFLESNPGATQKIIAAHFGISPSRVGQVLNGRSR